MFPPIAFSKPFKPLFHNKKIICATSRIRTPTNCFGDNRATITPRMLCGQRRIRTFIFSISKLMFYRCNPAYHYSFNYSGKDTSAECFFKLSAHILRRVRDSNSWILLGPLVFKTSTISHSDNSP